MRISLLDLFAYGPFTNTRLDFSAHPNALHIIFGRNEAGKSTTLRAVTGLLYGIPVRTPDAHSHDPSSLRIGAEIVSRDGQRLSFVRRKGNKHTLLGPDAQPLGDDALSPWLGGLNEDLFRAMFGLDHERLRQGAEALLRGGGDLGEGLFDAGLGASAIRRVQQELGTEAESIYKARGQAPRLNAALRKLREAQKQRREAALAPAKWQAQRDALEQVRGQRDAAQEQRRRLGEERARLKRAMEVLPRLARLDQLRVERQALGEVVSLPEDSAALRSGAERELAAQRRELSQVREQATRIDRALKELPDVPAPQLGEDAVEDLRNRFGSHRKAEQDLPQRRGELKAAREDTRTLQMRLGDTASEREAAVPAATRAKLRKLSEDARALGAERAQLERERAARKREIRELSQRVQDLGRDRDVADLRIALSAAQRFGDGDERGREVQARLARLEHTITRGLSQLSLELSIADLACLSLPLEASVEQLAQERAQLDAQAEQLLQQRDTLEQQAQQLARRRAALEGEGEVPSERALDQLRGQRDGRWEALRAHLRQGSSAPQDEVAQYEASTRSADLLADRLRREAERVSSLASLVADAEANQARLEQAERTLADHEASRQRWQQSWQALWAPSQLPAQAPREMRARVQRLRQLVAEAERHGDTQLEHDRLRETADTHRSDLGEQLRRLEVPHDEPALANLVALAERTVAESLERTHSAREIERARADAARALSALDERAASLDDQHEAWRTRWAREVAELGMPAQASPEEALACLEDLDALGRKREAMRALQRRIEGMERDAAALQADVRRTCETHLPEAVEQALPEAVQALVQALQTARDLRRDRGRLERELAEVQMRLADAELAANAADEQLGTLMQRAGAQDLAQLIEAENRSAQARELDRDLHEVEQQLLSVGEGASVDALREQVRDVQVDRCRARLAELEEEQEEALQALRDHDHTVGRMEAGLELLEQESGAAQAAEEVETQIAEVRALGHRYAVVRLASALLAREVERYRDLHQGPVLARASSLFEQLTLGRYQGLRADYDAQDRAVLRCVRADGGAEIPVEGLSDGTRDQLYLALRLASLERFCEQNEALPLVLDDCFIHFDDDRVKAALVPLARFAGQSQVLFFTHHARIVELAKQALPAGQVKVHDLGQARRAGRARNDGPLFELR